MFSDHSLATDSVFAEVQLVSCRNVLIYFDRDAAGPRARAVPRGAVPQGLPRPRLEGVAALLGARGRFAELVRERADLPEEGRGMTRRRTRASRIDAVVIGASAGGVEALSRAAAGAAGRRCAPPVFVVLHLPRERPSLLVEHLRAEVRAAGARGRGQGAGRAGHGLLRAARLPPAGRRRAARSRCRPTSRCTSRGRRSTCCSSPPRTSTAERLLGIILTGANEDGAAGLAAVRRAGGVHVVQDPATAPGAAHAEAALDAQPGATSCCRSTRSPTLLRTLAIAPVGASLTDDADVA